MARRVRPVFNVKDYIEEDFRQLLLKQYKGSGTQRTHYVKYLEGEDLTRAQAIIAKCYECNCGYTSSRVDCKNPHCPLYPFMPYKDK